MKIKAVSGTMLTLFLMLTLSTVLVKPMVATYPFEDIFKKDLLDLANGTPKIESIYIKSWMDTRPSGHLWAFIRINYTAGLSDHEKISVQDYVQRQLESKWYIDIVERNYYYVIFIWPTPPVPWPGFVIGDLNVGFKSVTVAQVTHDIAVISVTPYPTMVGLDEPVNVTVIIENQGTENETFNVTTYYNNTGIETLNVIDLAPNKNVSLTFAWNTSGVTAGTYFINATASIVPGETDTADNTLVSLFTVDVVSLYIAVLPRSTVDPTLTPGQNYTVSIYTNYNGSDIWGYEFDLAYNPLVLHGVEVVNGDLIEAAEEDYTVISTEGEFDNTLGTLSLTGAAALNMTVLPYVPLNSTGPGLLANVTFTIVGLGESPITLGDKTKLVRTDGTKIIDYIDDQNPDPTRGKFLHGSFQNVPEVTHDVAVTSVNYPQSVEEGEPVTINVTIRNNGTVAEGVSVRVYYGFDPVIGPFNLIEEETVTLESGVNATLTFTWNTTDVETGTHPITAVAELLGGVTDVNPDDNTLQSGEIIMVPVRAIYIRADGNVDPPTALISSVDNITYTLTGNITSDTDGIVIERDNIAVDGADRTLQGTGIGIMLLSRSNVTIKNMEIKAFHYGILLGYSSNNIISENKIIGNHRYGIELYESSNNIIYHNNFVNTKQVRSSRSTNVWSDGYPSGGNYWSNYNGTDFYSGPHQDETGSDGIGDTPYKIDIGNRDYYPLMGPISFFDAGTWNDIAYCVNVASNSTVSDFYFNPDEGAFIRFNVTGPEGTTGFCRVVIPKELLWVEDGQWAILVGGEPVEYVVIPDENCTYICFTYSHTTKTVEIIGTNVVPEFPTWTSMLLILILLSVAIAIYKRRLLKTPIH